VLLAASLFAASLFAASLMAVGGCAAFAICHPPSAIRRLRSRDPPSAQPPSREAQTRQL
jgi:hypothetical protein